MFFLNLISFCYDCPKTSFEFFSFCKHWLIDASWYIVGQFNKVYNNKYSAWILQAAFSLQLYCGWWLVKTNWHYQINAATNHESNIIIWFHVRRPIYKADASPICPILWKKNMIRYVYVLVLSALWHGLTIVLVGKCGVCIVWMNRISFCTCAVLFAHLNCKWVYKLEFALLCFLCTNQRNSNFVI